MILVALVPNRDVIISLLRENRQTISNDVDFSFARIGEGKGFASLLYKTRIGEASYAVKITDPRGKLEGFEDLDIHGIVHNREVDFYRWASQLPECDQSQFKMPKYFGGRYCDGSEEGVLILEDFSDRMISEIDFLEGFSIELVKDIIQSIVGYQNVYMNAVEKFPVPDKKVIFGTLRKIAETSIDALSVKSWITEEAKKQLYHIAKNVDKLQVQLPEYAKNCPRTLIHSDLWPNNMLYERNGDDNRLLSIIDWQCYTIGNPIFDVATLCSITLTPETRRANEAQLVEYYWNEMQKSCGARFNIDLDTAHKLYRHCQKWSAVMLTIMVYFQKMMPGKPDETHVDGELSERLKALLEDIKEIE